MVDKIDAAFQIDWKTVIIGVATFIAALLAIIAAAKEIIKIFGIEFSWQRKRREDHELLVKTAQNYNALKEHHENDFSKIEEQLSTFMLEMRNIVTETQNNVNQYSENRIQDRAVSLDREKRLNDRIDLMAETDKSRDRIIDGISNGLDKLTSMFIDKQINDYRWEIINFATAISEKKPCNRDGFKHCFATYEKYEKILEENSMENGEVEISMEIINEAYKEKMLEGFN